MLKMQEVYKLNPALGDANSPEILKKISENAQKLNDLQVEYRKFQVCSLLIFGVSLITVVVVLLFYVHGKHLRSCRDGQLT